MSDHQPVLLHEVLDALCVRSDGFYVDATYGRGGHARAILERLGSDGRLTVLDRDPQAIAAARAAHGDDARVTIVHASFGDLTGVVGAPGRVDGLLLDLGVSSPQLDQPERGFSFANDGPLDMRMDTTAGESAAQWLARATIDELTDVIRRYGEERHPRRIARAIDNARREEPITRTGQLAALLSSVIPARDPRRHPATRVFQAIRIQVNDELGQLEAALDASLALLAPGGRLCVISFHSLEDRCVKRFMRDASQVRGPFRGLPNVPPEYRPQLKLIGKAVTPGEAEITANVRARSARLRIAERL